MLAGVTIGVLGSLFLPRRIDLTVFDGAAVGRLDAAMWRSYYERRPVRLFWQLTRTLQIQFHTGLVRSFPLAYHAARAAFVFKDGRSRRLSQDLDENPQHQPQAVAESWVAVTAQAARPPLYPEGWTRLLGVS